jgi:hypothetical protein
MRVSISSKFDLIETARANVDATEFFSNSYKRSREWHILGAMQRLLKTNSDDIPEFAEERLRPDFMTFRHDGSPWLPVEITEALRPHDRRHKRYKQTKSTGQKLRWLPPPQEKPWETLQEQISKKARMGYSPDTCLIVYFGLWLFDFPTWSEPVHQLLSAQHKSMPFRDINSFSRVFVLTSGMDAMVELAKEI